MSHGDKGRMSRYQHFYKDSYNLCCLGIFLMVTALSGLLCGCSIEAANRTKVKDLEYSIVEDAEVPEEIMTMIEEKKAADFKVTYEMDENLYIVRGYGEQATGGYSIRIKDCYLTTNAILFDTELIGPRKGENTSASPSYPYIVIKMESRDESTIFE